MKHKELKIILTYLDLYTFMKELLMKLAAELRHVCDRPRVKKSLDQIIGKLFRTKQLPVHMCFPKTQCILKQFPKQSEKWD